MITIIIIVAVTSISEDEQSSSSTTLTEQETRELIQNEISKFPQIAGVHAQNIYTILDLECLPQMSFHAVYDPDDGYTKFRHTTPDGMWYEFRVIDDDDDDDDALEYKSNLHPTEWITFGDDSWMWEDDAKAGVKQYIMILYLYKNILKPTSLTVTNWETMKVGALLTMEFIIPVKPISNVTLLLKNMMAKLKMGCASCKKKQSPVNWHKDCARHMEKNAYLESTSQ